MYDIIIRFPSKEMADYFCGQMSDGFGEQFMNFSFYKQIEGTDGTKKEHYEKVEKDGINVFFVDYIEDFSR